MENVSMLDIYKILVNVQSDVSEMKKDIQKLDVKIDNVKEELNTKIDNVKEELNTKIDNVKEELNTKIDNVRSELKSDISNLASETAKLVMEDVVPYFEKEYSKLSIRVTKLEQFAMKQGYVM